MEHDPLSPDAGDVPPNHWMRLADYVAGEGSPDERAAFERWLRQDPRRRATFEQVQRTWHATPRFRREADVDGAWAMLSARMTHGTSATPSLAPMPAQRTAPAVQSSRRRFRRIAVPSLGIALGIALLVTTIVTHDRATSGDRGSANARGVRYATQSGQRAALRLSDGSRVTLGPRTILDVDEGFGRSARTVRLSGEAYFQVAPDLQTPFIVRTGGVVSQVLGTAFNVRRYPGDREAHVTVETGKIQLSAQDPRGGSVVRGSHTVLTASMVGDITDSGEVHVTPNVRVTDYTAWTTGRLVFRKTPVRDIVVELGRAYDVEIRLADSSLASRTLTWTVSVDQRSLAGILDVLADALGAHVTQSGRTVTIVPGLSASRRLVDPHTSSTSEHHYGR